MLQEFPAIPATFIMEDNHENAESPVPSDSSDQTVSSGNEWWFEELQYDEGMDTALPAPINHQEFPESFIMENEHEPTESPVPSDSSDETVSLGSEWWFEELQYDEGMDIALLVPINHQASNDDVILISSSASQANYGVRSERPAASVNQDAEVESRPNMVRIGSDQAGTGGNPKSELSGSAQPAPAFKCPICRGPLVEEALTLCGHVFCMSCLTAAIADRRECPTCSMVITPNDIVRIYLPTP